MEDCLDNVEDSAGWIWSSWKEETQRERNIAAAMPTMRRAVNSDEHELSAGTNDLAHRCCSASSRNCIQVTYPVRGSCSYSDYVEAGKLIRQIQLGRSNRFAAGVLN